MINNIQQQQGVRDLTRDLILTKKSWAAKIKVVREKKKQTIKGEEPLSRKGKPDNGAENKSSTQPGNARPKDDPSNE